MPSRQLHAVKRLAIRYSSSSSSNAPYSPPIIGLDTRSTRHWDYNKDMQSCCRCWWCASQFTWPTSCKFELETTKSCVVLGRSRISCTFQWSCHVSVLWSPPEEEEEDEELSVLCKQLSVNRSIERGVQFLFYIQVAVHDVQVHQSPHVPFRDVWRAEFESSSIIAAKTICMSRHFGDCSTVM